jgi:hypothetical protein
MKKFVIGIGITALVLCSVGFAQVPGFPKVQHQVNQQQQETLLQIKKDAVAQTNHGTDSSTDCAFTFTSGTNNTFLNYCVTGNGNVVVLETPQGHKQVSFDLREGYGICDLNSNVAYSDYGGFGDSGNWGPATVVNHSGTSVKIIRSTNDGIWTLTQTITQVSGNTPSVKIVMSLKNNTAVERAAFLMRYADVDADANVSNELDATFNTAVAYNSILSSTGGAPFGLMLQNVGNTNFGFDAFSQNTPSPPAPCNPFTNVAGPVSATDGSIVQLYLLDLLKSATGTVTVAYRGM